MIAMKKIDFSSSCGESFDGYDRADFQAINVAVIEKLKHESVSVGFFCWQLFRFTIAYETWLTIHSSDSGALVYAPLLRYTASWRPRMHLEISGSALEGKNGQSPRKMHCSWWFSDILNANSHEIKMWKCGKFIRWWSIVRHLRWW